MKTMTYQNQQIQLGYGNINHLIPHELWHCELSLPALGLASYLYTLPKCWKLSVTHLSKQLLMSKNTCRKYLKEIFENQKARELFQVVEREVATYDFEEGFTAYDYDDRQEELEKFTSSVAKDVSEENKKRVMIIQTQEQRYLFNFIVGLKPKEFASEIEMTERVNEKGSKFDHYIKESKDSFKDSSNKTRAQKSKNTKTLADFLDLQDFTEQEQELIRFWITYKQERAKAKLTPSQIDFQLRKITRLKNEGQDIVAVIERSLENSWSGLFPITLPCASGVTPPHRSCAAGVNPASAPKAGACQARTETKQALGTQILGAWGQNKPRNGKDILGAW